MALPRGSSSLNAKMKIPHPSGNGVMGFRRIFLNPDPKGKENPPKKMIFGFGTKVEKQLVFKPFILKKRE
jgi:hypothetical protein